MNTQTFQDAIRSAGLQPPDVIEPGRFHKFPGEGKRNSNRAAWCKMFPDGTGGIFGDYSTGLSADWQEKRETPYTPAEREAFKRHVAEAKAQADAERKAKQAEAQAQATSIWNAPASALEATQPAIAEHPYTPPMLERHSKEIAWVALAAIVVSAIVIYRTPSVNSSGGSSSTQTVGSSGGSSPTQNMSYMLVEQDKIKSRLKDPDSAQFRNVFVSSKYVVCGEVNAKNSFGGNTGFVRFISGGDLQVFESDMAAGEMDKAWPQFCKR